MKRSRIEDEEEHSSSSERWLLTYSDMITLLLALFIIMYGMSAVDSTKVQNLSKEFEQVLNPSDNKSETEETGTSANYTTVDKISKKLNNYISKNKLSSQVSLVESDAGINIQLKDSLLFQPNTADLLDEQSPIIQEISGVLSLVYDEIDHVSIIGNTADVGNRDRYNEEDAWRLSATRALKVLTLLTDQGVKPDKLSIEGHSHYSPIATNKTSEGRAKNRRVEIMIYKNSSTDEKTP